MRAVNHRSRLPAVWIVAAAVAVAGLSTACKRRPKYDQSTPEAAIASLFSALEGKRIPRDIDRFIADPDELARWRFVCENQGCVGGSFAIVARDIHAARATLYLDFEVTGDYQARVMRGSRTPVTLTREGERWMVRRIGQAIRTRPNDARPDDAPAPAPPRRGDAPTATE